MADWLTILLSIILSTIASLTAAYNLQERRWRRRFQALLSTLRTYRDVNRAARKLGRRPRRRYIVVEILSEEPLPMDEVERAIKSVVREYLGVAGLASSGVSLVYYDENRGRGVVRVNQEYRYQVLGLLGLLRHVGNSRVLIVPLAVTGSLKRAKRLLG